MKFKFIFKTQAINIRREFQNIDELKKCASYIFQLQKRELFFYYIDEENEKIVLINEEDFEVMT